jgi:hypothetical protein
LRACGESVRVCVCASPCDARVCVRVCA